MQETISGCFFSEHSVRHLSFKQGWKISWYFRKYQNIEKIKNLKKNYHDIFDIFDIFQKMKISNKSWMLHADAVFNDY